ncbi:MAG: hypothetical protein AB9861_10615 [Methanosarcina sp.]
MVKIGDIYLGGEEIYNNQIYNSGVSFFLTNDSKISNTLPFENGKWDVELKEGQQSIVARSTDVLSEEQILNLGLKYCQQAIDFLSTEYAEYLSIQELGNFHTILYKNDDKFILKQVQTIGFTLETDIEVIVRDSSGNIVPQPAPPEPKWTLALRFYRLAQNTSDLYEAYRNAYLSFESLLCEMHPIPMKKNGKPAQGERNWLKDALKELELKNKIQLIDYVPQGITDPVEYFVKSQYDDIRCKLFHAKGVFADECPINIIIPVEIFNPIDVSNAYEKLMLLVKQILKVEYNIKFKGGVVTHIGFKSTMENNLSNDYVLEINADDSPINGNLIEHRFPLIEEKLEEKQQLVKIERLAEIESLVSPRKLESDLLLNLQYDTTVPGIVNISGEINKNELSSIHLYRTSLLYIEVMFRFVRLIIFCNKDGVDLSGIDKFESHINIKLKNKGWPQK